MNSKLMTIFGILLLGGVVFAISGATVGTEVERGRWSGTTAGSITTEGGNVSGVNISSSVLTDKWASFYGDATASIVLADSGATAVYTWSWTPATGGEVCLTQDGAFPWASAEATTGGDVDTAFSFTTTDADSATNTLSGSCGITLTEATVSGSEGVTLGSGFETCAVGDGTETAEGDFAFCTVMNSTGVNYANEAADYEVMVPTSEGAGTETYYFFIELN